MYNYVRIIFFISRSHVKVPVVHVRVSMDYGNAKRPSMHLKRGRIISLLIVAAMSVYGTLEEEVAQSNTFRY